MKGVIFENKKLRESFMQEILNAADSASYRSSLEKYINNQHLTIAIALGFPPDDPEALKNERVTEYSEVDINTNVISFTPNPRYSGESAEVVLVHETNFVHRLFVMTT